ncbi:MAG: DNA-directed RNA polymerase [Candidatus ainarchaeum sp.]|jgi:DNA-directed RNA polymerase subunit E'|nr:DNA-directed RNA polymerase [Candidatus ainarchaeum sp.]
MGYKKYVLEGITSILPQGISGELNEIIINQLSREYEGVIDKNIGLIIAVTDLIEHDIGEIVPGDPNVFFKVKFSVITYLPRLHEIVSGVVTQATDFGAFLKIGPVEGLCHVSQVMDDFNSYNGELPGFVGKDSKQSLVVEDVVLSRIANISLKSTVADTKIGLTMRQFGLGKPDWQTTKEKKERKIIKKDKKTDTKVSTTKTNKKTTPKK